MTLTKTARIAAHAALLGTLSACASYAPQRLPDTPNAPINASTINIDPAQLPFRSLSSHVYNPADGLDMTEVAMLAVANNPQLRQSRDALGISRAQSFAAGLLPDPQLSVVGDRPTNGTSGNTNAFNLNLSYDVNALLQRSSRVGSAKADVRRVNLELLWQEWQTVSQARLLFTRLTAQTQLMVQLQAARTMLNERVQRSRKALAAGNVTLDFASAEVVALQTTERQINELERSQLQNRASLNALLGLAGDAKLVLVGAPQAAHFDIAAVQTDLTARLNQRPDVQALRAGYTSQEEKFRGAVLAQYPALNLGLTRARDTSGLYTMGFGMTLSLPIFNRNRGNIAIEKATRSKLYNEYQNRLNSAQAEISTALDNLPLLQAQLKRTQDGITLLKNVAQRAQSAFEAGNLLAPDYVRLQTALLDKQTEAINLQEALMEQQIALETLLGPDLPTQTSTRNPS